MNNFISSQSSIINMQLTKYQPEDVTQNKEFTYSKLTLNFVSWIAYFITKGISMLYHVHSWKMVVTLQICRMFVHPARWYSLMGYLDGLVQEWGNSIDNALQLRLSCIDPSISDTYFQGLYSLSG